MQLSMAEVCYEVLKAYDTAIVNPTSELMTIDTDIGRIKKAISLLLEKNFLEMKRHTPGRLGTRRSDDYSWDDLEISYDGVMEFVRLKTLFDKKEKPPDSREDAK